MIWYRISLLLCSVGFLKEIRPSEPFVTDYMQEPYRNVTQNEVKYNFDFLFHNFHMFFQSNFDLCIPVDSLRLSDSDVFESHFIGCDSTCNGLVTVSIL